MSVNRFGTYTTQPLQRVYGLPGQQFFFLTLCSHRQRLLRNYGLIIFNFSEKCIHKFAKHYREINRSLLLAVSYFMITNLIMPEEIELSLLHQEFGNTDDHNDEKVELRKKHSGRSTAKARPKFAARSRRNDRQNNYTVLQEPGLLRVQRTCEAWPCCFRTTLIHRKVVRKILRGICFAAAITLFLIVRYADLGFGKSDYKGACCAIQWIIVSLYYHHCAH